MHRSNTGSKRPAQWVGGQRRRLVRKSGLPRSNTAPVLNPQAATAGLIRVVVGDSPRASEDEGGDLQGWAKEVGGEGGGVVEGGTGGEGMVVVDSHRGVASHGVVTSHGVPVSHIPAAAAVDSDSNLTAVTHSTATSNSTAATSPQHLDSPTIKSPYDQRPQTPVSPHQHTVATASSTLTTASISTAGTVIEGKKRHGLFGSSKLKEKSKDRDKPEILQLSLDTSTPMIISSLPPSTPSKAVQFLGLGAGVEVEPRSSSSLRRAHRQTDGISDGRPVRPALQLCDSVDLLTMLKEILSRPTRFKEEDVEPDPPKMKKMQWGGSGKKAMRVLGNLPSLASSSRHAANHNHTTLLPRSPGEDAELRYSSGSDFHTGSHQFPPARPLPISPRRRTRRKGPKSLDRMSPITEASFEEHRYRHNDRCDKEDETELEVISEYEHDYPPRSASMFALPRLHPELILSANVTYELDDYDLSPTDGYIEEEPEEKEHDPHPGTKVDLKKMSWLVPPTTVQNNGRGS